MGDRNLAPLHLPLPNDSLVETSQKVSVFTLLSLIHTPVLIRSINLFIVRSKTSDSLPKNSRERGTRSPFSQVAMRVCMLRGCDRGLNLRGKRQERASEGD